MVEEPGSNDTCRIVAGVWIRLWEEDPLGDSAGADRDTLVLWTQTPCGLYVDLRLPKESPGQSFSAAARAGYVPNPQSISADGLDACTYASQGDFDIFMKQKSFAGRHLQVSSGDTTSSGEALTNDTVLADLASDCDAAIPLCTCFWKRDIDYQPPSGGLDIGVCASASPLESDGKVDLRETGDDASYAEGWRRLAGTNDGPFVALELIEENGKSRKGFWAVTGNRFAYAVGRPEKVTSVIGSASKSPGIEDCVGMTLPIALEYILGSDETNTKKLALAWSYCGVAGTISESDQWTIEQSINPNLVGCDLIQSKSSTKKACSYLTQATACDDIIDQVLIDDNSSNKTVRRWKIVEISDGFEMPFRGSH